MKESILVAVEIYLIGFAISILIAALIKGMHGVIRHFAKKNEQEEKKESEVSA